MNEKQEKEFSKRITKRLHMYEDIIADPDNVEDYWYRCDICSIFGVSSIPILPNRSFCKPCLLYNCSDAETVRNRHTLEHDATFISLQVKKAAKYQHKWILKKLEQAGWEYV